MMTSRERVLKAIGHETTEIMPSTLYLEDGLRETLARRADLRESCVDYPNDTVRILWENIHTVLDETSYLDPFGVRYVRAGGGDQFVDPPMKEPDPGQIPRMKLLPEGEVERILATRREHPDKFI